MTSRPRRWNRVWRRCYRLLLLAYPRDFRRRVGEDMADVFADVCREEWRRHGPASLIGLAARTLRDVARNGSAERFGRDSGLSPGNPTRSRLPRDQPAARGDRFMSVVINDVRFASRALRKQPVFSFTVIIVLAVGIAGTTGIFGVFNGLFLRPLPFVDPDRLVNIDETAPQWNLEFVAVNFTDFAAWREQNQSFEAMAVFDGESVNMSLDGEASRVSAALITSDIFEVLPISPLIGRAFTAAEDQPGAEGVAMLAHSTWRDRFGADPAVLGRILMLDSEPHTIIGVLPPEAVLIEGDVWIPLRADTTQRQGSWWLSGIGRLKPGVSLEGARADLERIHKSMIGERPANEVTSPVVIPIRDRILGDARFGTAALFAGVGVVLVIACANIAGLMLARSTARSREVGIRAALGAGRRRIAQQLMTESLLLATCGSALGVALGYGMLRAALAAAPDDIPAFVSFEMDVRFLAFTVALTVGAALLFGLAPALRVARTDPRQALQAAGRATAGSSRRRGLNTLVVCEIALALMLLIGAGLFMATVKRLQQVDPGFDPRSVLSYRISLPDASYGSEDQQRAFFEEHLAQLATLPGVVDAGAATNAPLGGHAGYFFTAEGAEPRGEDEPRPVTLVRWVTDDYFRAIGVKLLAGRTFTVADSAEQAPPVVVVNQKFAEYHWDGDDPIGKRITTGGDESEWITVVGLAQDVKHYGLAEEMRPGIYLPFDRSPSANMTIVARTAVEPLSLADEARRLVRSQDPEVPIYDVATMEQQLADSLWARKAGSWTFAIFAGVALVLAISGIYGVVSYAVGQRTREIGIRMALGARRSQVLRQVVYEGIALIGAGAVLGLVAAATAARGVSSLLYGVSATEPVVYIGVTAFLLGVAVLANLVPARRAAAIDPVEALRRE